MLTYVFLTDCTPFGEEKKLETLANITKAEYDFPEELFGGLSENAKDFIRCLLLKKMRYETHKYDKMTI